MHLLLLNGPNLNLLGHSQRATIARRRTSRASRSAASARCSCAHPCVPRSNACSALACMARRIGTSGMGTAAERRHGRQHPDWKLCAGVQRAAVDYSLVHRQGGRLDHAAGSSHTENASRPPGLSTRKCRETRRRRLICARSCRFWFLSNKTVANVKSK